MIAKTQIEVLTLMGEILKQMQESQAMGISQTSYYIEGVNLNDLFASSLNCISGCTMR